MNFKNPDIALISLQWYYLQPCGTGCSELVSLLPAHLSHNQGRLSGACSKAFRNKPSHHAVLTLEPTSLLSLPTALWLLAAGTAQGSARGDPLEAGLDNSSAWQAAPLSPAAAQCAADSWARAGLWDPPLPLLGLPCHALSEARQAWSGSRGCSLVKQYPLLGWRSCPTCSAGCLLPRQWKHSVWVPAPARDRKPEPGWFGWDSPGRSELFTDTGCLSQSHNLLQVSSFCLAGTTLPACKCMVRSNKLQEHLGHAALTCAPSLPWVLTPNWAASCTSAGDSAVIPYLISQLLDLLQDLLFGIFFH